MPACDYEVDKEEFMGKTTVAVLTAIACIAVFSLMLVPLAGATGYVAPALQTTETATAAATEAATEAATAAATEAAATPTRAPSALPTTGGDTGVSTLLLGAAALILIGVAIALFMGRRRDVQS